MTTPLGLDADELAMCVACGMCLPHCPTFRVTGDELASPRGRIALMRRVESGEGRIDEGFLSAIDSCVQCRGCEPACPSAVPFGHLMEGTRAAIAHRQVPRWQRVAYGALGRHRLLLAGSTAVAVGQRLRVVPRRLVPTRLPLRRPRLEATGEDVWLFTGCVMDAWQRDVHVAVVRVVTATGAGIALPDTSSAACCGALHAHAGLADQAHRLAARAASSFPGTAPVLVDAAGCGAALREGPLGGRAVDVHAWLAERLDRLPPARRRIAGVVAVQDPCHLRHVQRTHQHVRTVLAPYVERLVELDDDGLCCGAGGAYAALHPALASEIRQRKLDAIARSGATVVASANPGCAMHLAAAAGVRVAHPVQLIEEAVRP
jgi:glycolate oxidase iron-sulfur subunit